MCPEKKLLLKVKFTIAVSSTLIFTIVDLDVPLYTSRRSPLSLSEVKSTKLGENRLKSDIL